MKVKKLIKMNFGMPEDIAITSSKSEVNRCRDSRVISLTRKECRWTDRQTDGFSVLVKTPPLMCMENTHEGAYQETNTS